jgi:hypothetical protein
VQQEERGSRSGRRSRASNAPDDVAPQVKRANHGLLRICSAVRGRRSVAPPASSKAVGHIARDRIRSANSSTLLGRRAPRSNVIMPVCGCSTPSRPGSTVTGRTQRSTAGLQTKSITRDDLPSEDRGSNRGRSGQEARPARRRRPASAESGDRGSHSTSASTLVTSNCRSSRCETWLDPITARDKLRPSCCAREAPCDPSAPRSAANPSMASWSHKLFTTCLVRSSSAKHFILLAKHSLDRRSCRIYTRKQTSLAEFACAVDVIPLLDSRGLARWAAGILSYGASHSLTVRSSLAVASCFPSGRNTTLFMAPVCPFRASTS